MIHHKLEYAAVVWSLSSEKRYKIRMDSEDRYIDGARTTGPNI
ncbi:hypothetical protein E2C01_102394 [Portunus trituberculatus]|uniref:Uncharacterized protein n=1 Tax=Portunus trituberculatus TaxID=210409 RepID=A0A5B7KIC4_PORTR|nr:hypothetical protein [Portunus trituberculatus]